MSPSKLKKPTRPPWEEEKKEKLKNPFIDENDPIGIPHGDRIQRPLNHEQLVEHSKLRSNRKPELCDLASIFGRKDKSKKAVGSQHRSHVSVNIITNPHPH